MKNTTKWMSWLGAGAVVLTGVAGCGSQTDKENPSQADANRAGAVSGTAENVGTAAENVGTAASNTVGNAGSALANTPKIKTALGAAPAMAGSKIDVTTMGNKVMLQGTVKSAAQKTMAESIAKKNAPGMTIDNKLTMSGGKMGGKMSGGKMKGKM